MSRLLYIMIGMPSCYHSGLEFCSRLAAAGHEVSVACNRDVASLASARGIPFSLLEAGEERRRAFVTELRAIDSLHPIARPLARLQAGLRHRRESFQPHELDRLVERQRPDVLAIDIECHYAIVTTRRHGIPTLLCSRFYDHFHTPGHPPLHSQRMPLADGASEAGANRSVLSRLPIAAEWWALRVKRLAQDLRDALSVRRFKPIDYRCTSPVALRALARSQGQTPSALFSTRDWLLPHAYRSLPVLSFTAAELDFPHPVHPLLHHAGPMVSRHGSAFPEQTVACTDAGDAEHTRSELPLRASTTERSENSDGQTLDDWLAVQCHEGRKLVYCSMGTWLRSDGVLLGHVLSLAAQRTDLAFVLGLGGLAPTSSLGTIPDNARVLEAAPQAELLAVADVAILHAGIASLNEALQWQTPALVMSVGTNDQDGCAARHAWHRLGRVMDRKTATPHRIGQALDALLSDSALADRLAAVARQFDRYREDRVVETLVETLADLHPKEMTSSARHRALA